MDDYIEIFLEDVSELEEKTVSVVRRGRLTKRKALAGRSALQICKQQNPALYKKYERFRKRYMEVRSQILKRYGAKGRLQARKHI